MFKVLDFELLGIEVFGLLCGVFVLVDLWIGWFGVIGVLSFLLIGGVFFWVFV